MSLSDAVNDDNFIPQTFYWGGVLFLIAWVFLLWLVSQISGWSDLAKRYATDLPELVEAGPIQWRGWQYGYFRGWVGYKGCLWVGLSSLGLCLKTGPDILFRFAHPPLCIPWQAITVKGRRRRFFWDMVELSFAEAGVSLLLPARIFQNEQPWLTLPELK